MGTSTHVNHFSRNHTSPPMAGIEILFFTLTPTLYQIPMIRNFKFYYPFSDFPSFFNAQHKCKSLAHGFPLWPSFFPKVLHTYHFQMYLFPLKSVHLGSSTHRELKYPFFHTFPPWAEIEIHLISPHF